MISNNCLRAQFPFSKNGLQVVIHRVHADLEQLGEESLRQPNRFVLKPALDPRAAILRLVEDDFGVGQRLVAHGFSLLSM